MMRTFEYRLYPNRYQQSRLMACLHITRQYYNEMLELTKAHYHQTGNFLFQNELWAAFKGRSGEYVPASTVLALAERLDRALMRYLRHKKQGLQAGFPRFKSANRWRSIDLKQYRSVFRVSDDQRHLIVPAKLGRTIKIKLHRPLEGTPKTAHLILRADGHWYVLIVCDVPTDADAQRAHEGMDGCPHDDIGLDMGLKAFITDSEGGSVENPRYYRRSQKVLRRKQRALSRRTKGSRRWKKAARNVAKTHLQVKRQRRDFAFKMAKGYAEGYRRIYVEDLNIRFMVRNHRLAKSIHDAGWHTFLEILADKAARAGHEVVRIPPQYTTQDCSHCGERTEKSLSVRTHRCMHCGYVADRDLNAALNILRAGAPPSGTVGDGPPDEPRSRCL